MPRVQLRDLCGVRSGDKGNLSDLALFADDADAYEAIRDMMYPRRFPIAVLAREFYRMVRRRGRSSEFWVVLRLALRTNPFMLFGMIRPAWNLLRTGRLALPHDRDRIQCIADLDRYIVPREVA